MHKKISANIAKAEAAIWADVKAVQADVNALAAKMGTPTTTNRSTTDSPQS